MRRRPLRAMAACLLLLPPALAGCSSVPGCPLLASGFLVSIAEDFHPTLATVHVKTCTDEGCRESDVPVQPVPSNPDLRTVFVSAPLEADRPIQLTLSDPAGSFEPQQAEIVPQADYYFGRECGKMTLAAAALDEQGLRSVPYPVSTAPVTR